jgi:hypothetical protein
MSKFLLSVLIASTVVLASGPSLPTETTDTIRSAADDASNKAAAALDDASKKAAAALDDASNKAAAALDDASNKAAAAFDDASKKAAAGINQAADATSSTVERAGDSVAATAKNLEESGNSFTKNIAKWIKLIALGLGILVFALITLCFCGFIELKWRLLILLVVTAGMSLWGYFIATG